MSFQADLRTWYVARLQALFPADSDRIYAYEPEIWHFEGFAEAFDTGMADGRGLPIYRGWTVEVTRMPNEGTRCLTTRLYIVVIGQYESLYDGGASSITFGDNLELVLDALEVLPADMKPTVGTSISRVEAATMTREIDTIIWPQGMYAKGAEIRQTITRER